MSTTGFVEQNIKRDTEQWRADLNYALRIPHLLMRPLGLWPISSLKYMTLRSISIAISVTILALLVIPICMHAIVVVKGFKARLNVLGPMSFCIMNSCIYGGIMIKNHDLRDCIEEISYDWRENILPAKRQIMVEYAKMARLFTSISIIFMFSGGFPYSIIFPLAKGTTVIGNLSLRTFSYPSYYIFFDPHTNFTVVYFLQTLGGFLAYTLTCALISIGILSTLHICGQVDIISWMLQDLSTNFDTHYLGVIVKKHIRSLKFASRLERILSEMCLIQSFGCTFNMCALAYYLILGFEEKEGIFALSCSMLLMSFTYNIFIFCYIGELLTQKYSSIGDTVYSLNWHDFPPKEAKNLLIIIASTRYPVILTAGKLLTLTLRNFSNVLKIAITYLNMVRTVAAKH